jgi:hypothetical protein
MRFGLTIGDDANVHGEAPKISLSALSLKELSPQRDCLARISDRLRMEAKGKPCNRTRAVTA